MYIQYCNEGHCCQCILHAPVAPVLVLGIVGGSNAYIVGIIGNAIHSALPQLLWCSVFLCACYQVRSAGFMWFIFLWSSGLLFPTWAVSNEVFMKGMVKINRYQTTEQGKAQSYFVGVEYRAPMPYITLENYWTAVLDVMDKRDFALFEFIEPIVAWSVVAGRLIRAVFPPTSSSYLSAVFVTGVNDHDVIKYFP